MVVKTTFSCVFLDFNLITTQVTITPRATGPCIGFRAVEDGLGLEGIEMLILSLSGPPTVNLTNPFITVYIEDSDGKWLIV